MAVVSEVLQPASVLTCGHVLHGGDDFTWLYAVLSCMWGAQRQGCVFCCRRLSALQLSLSATAQLLWGRPCLLGSLP